MVMTWVRSYADGRGLSGQDRAEELRTKKTRTDVCRRLVNADPQKPTVFINWELLNKKEPWDP